MGIAMRISAAVGYLLLDNYYDGSRGSFAICKAIYDNRHNKLKECPDVRELDITFDHDTYWSPTGWTDETEPTTGWLKPVTAPSPKE